MKQESHSTSYTVKDFLPLISIFSLIILILLIDQLYYGWSIEEGMRISMASFFLVFGFFKIINITGFAKAYSMYDLVEKLLKSLRMLGMKSCICLHILPI